MKKKTAKRRTVQPRNARVNKIRPKKTPAKIKKSPVLVAVPAGIATPVSVVAETVAPVVFPTEQIALLRAGTVEVAVEAIELIAATGDVLAVAPLADVLANVDGYFHVVTRATAAMALGRFKTEESITALLAAARDGYAEVSCEAIIALGDLKAAAAVPTLIDIAENARGYYLNVTRHSAIRSLGKIKALTAQTVLANIALDGSDIALSAAAREALAQL